MAARATVEVRIEHPRPGAAAARVRRDARAFLAALGVSSALSILLTTDRKIRALNRTFRGKDQATDVLSFPAAPVPGGPPLLGDLVISLDTGRRRAKEDGRPVGRELARYLAHGLLHLLGYDHERSPREARRMARAEAALLGGEGMLGR